MRDCLLTWFFLGAVGGVVPLAADWVVRLATDKPATASAIIGRGELLLVSILRRPGQRPDMTSALVYAGTAGLAVTALAAGIDYFRLRRRMPRGRA